MSKNIKYKKKEISKIDVNSSQEIDKDNPTNKAYEQISNIDENKIKEDNIADNNSKEKKSNMKQGKKSKKSKKTKIILDASKDQSIINNTNTTNSEIISEMPNKDTHNEIIISEQSNKDTQKEPIVAEVINELPINHVIENKVVDTIYKIVYVFNNIDYYLKVKPHVKMIDIINRICKKTKMNLDKLCFTYNEHEITNKYHEMTVKEFFNFPINKSRPIIYVKIKQIIASPPKIKYEYNLFNNKIYPNKVKISNFPETYINSDKNEDINSIINTFYKDINIEPDFTCERQYKKLKENTSHINIETNDNIETSNSNIKSYIYEENKTEPNINNNNKNENSTYIVGFPTSNIAFDFKRYMSSLKLIKPKFKDIKIQNMLSKKKSPNKNKKTDEEEDRKYLNNYNYRYDTYLEENDLKKRNKIEVLNMISNNFQNSKINRLIRSSNNSSIYLNIQSPYSTPYDEQVKDNIENKKKWLYKKGFISSVNKNYSGLYV